MLTTPAFRFLEKLRYWLPTPNTTPVIKTDPLLLLISETLLAFRKPFVEALPVLVLQSTLEEGLRRPANPTISQTEPHHMYLHVPTCGYISLTKCMGILLQLMWPYKKHGHV